MVDDAAAARTPGTGAAREALPTPPVEEITQRWQARRSVDLLPAHLQDRHGIAVDRLTELDLGVFRVDRLDGPSWVARLFPSIRPLPEVVGDRDVLRVLADAGFSAERVPVAAPVSVLDGQGVLVTEFVEGVPRDRRRAAIRGLGGFGRLGAMLGRLHTLPGAGGVARAGGAWHHLADGGPDEEIAAARIVFAGAESGIGTADRSSYASVQAALSDLDGCAGLPEALIHPDFVLANTVVSADRGYVLVDWTGAGRGPRLWSLAFLLFSAGAGGDLGRVDAVAAGYHRHVRLEPEELSRLDRAVRARPIILQAWLFAAGRRELAAVAREIAEAKEIADAVADRARAAFTDLD